MNKFLQSCLVACVCLLQSQLATADTIADIYQIEVIVFEHNDPARFKSENWPKFVSKLDVNSAVDLNKLTRGVPESIDALETLNALNNTGDVPAQRTARESITLVEPQNYLLKNEMKLLKANSSERIIKHLGWNQPLANNVKSTPVYFSGGSDQEIAAILSIKPNRNVFNVQVNMVYKIQPEDKKYDPGVEEIKITRDVRVKKKEVFYVDHPVIGMMIIISPVLYASSPDTVLPN